MGNFYSVQSKSAQIKTKNSEEQCKEIENFHCSESEVMKNCDESESENTENYSVTKDLSRFQEELSKKREVRQTTMTNLREKMENLRINFEREKAKNSALIEFIDRNLDSESELVRNLMSQLNNLGETCTKFDILPTSESNTCQDKLNFEEEKRILSKNLLETQIELQNAKREIKSLNEDLSRLRLDCEHAEMVKQQEIENDQERLISVRKDLSESQFQLQIANAEILSLETDVENLKTQVRTLKDVVSASKEMLKCREDQVQQLREKIKGIEDSLQEHELRKMSEELKREYDRQIANMRHLRDLYNERERVARLERDNLLRQLDLRKNDLEAEVEKSKNLEEHVLSLQNDYTQIKDELIESQRRLCQTKIEAKTIKDDMNVVNQFMSKMLFGVSNNRINIDKLTQVLEENRSLLIDMAKTDPEMVDNGAFLPKLLYDIVSQVQVVDTEKSETEELKEDEKSVPSSEEIASKLPKVWKILIELLTLENDDEIPLGFPDTSDSEDCYKSVQTSQGIKTEVSVSKTFLKLKNLILEKKYLRQETDRLKYLNIHLEKRLESQEKRLSTVSKELTKTWHVVGRMQRQHRQLHTQEQILRYHLQQKRRLLVEIKDELENCRRKWNAAREKNDETDSQWQILKRERRKYFMSNSPESGYSDDQQTDDEKDEKKERRLKKRKMLFDGHNLKRYHSEPDITLWNELHPDENGAAEKGECSKKSKKRKNLKGKRASKAETAEEMFNRLLNLGTDDQKDTVDHLVEDSEDECSIQEDYESEKEVEIEEKTAPPSISNLVLSPEQIFNQKREARLKRMEELSTKIDTYDAKKHGTLTDTDLTEPSTSDCLSQSEKELLERRAARLERLEKEAKEFKNRLSRTLNRGSLMLEKINDIQNDQRKSKTANRIQEVVALASACDSNRIDEENEKTKAETETETETQTGDDEFDVYIQNLQLEGVNEEEIAQEIEELLNFDCNSGQIDQSPVVIPLEGVNEEEIINEIENLLSSDIILEEVEYQEEDSDSDDES